LPAYWNALIWLDRQLGVLSGFGRLLAIESVFIYVFPG